MLNKKNWSSDSFDDDDRPRWNDNTKSLRKHDYHQANGTYAYTTEKGINLDGETCWRTRRECRLTPGECIEPEDKEAYERGYYKEGYGDPVLYRLPQLIAATKKTPGCRVGIGEGEKDIETLESLGFIATCNPFGAGKWRDEFSPFLAGTDVVVFEDNDDAGRRDADKKVASVRPHARSVCRLKLPGLKEGGDISDWVAEKRAASRSDDAIREELSALIKQQSGLEIWNAGDDAGPIPPRGWLYGNVWCRGFPSSLLGDGGTGKSALRIVQGLSAATNRSLTGEHVFQRSRVLIISFEDGNDELRRRVRAAMLYHGVSHDEVDGWLFLYYADRKTGKLLTTNPKGGVIEGSLVDKLRATIRRDHIDVIILDPFVKTHSVEENDNSRMDEVIQILTDLAVEENIAVDFPHHTSKGRAAAPGDADRGRGASAVKDGARLVYTLTTMTTEEAKTFGIEEGVRRLYFRIDSGKVNITPPARDAKWFHLVGVSIGNATELYPNGDNVQTVEPWTPPETFAGLSDDVTNRILTEIDDGLPDGTLFSAATNVKEEKAAWRVVAKHALGKTEAQCREIIKAWLKAKALKEVIYHDKEARRDRKGLKVDDAKKGAGWM